MPADAAPGTFRRNGRMNSFLTRVRSRILAIVLMAIIPAILLIFYSAAERKRQISSEIENNALRLARFLASNLHRDISEAQAFLAVGTLLLRTQPPTEGLCRPDMAVFLGDSSIYSNIGVADTSGRVLCSAAPLSRGTSLEKLDWFAWIRETHRFTVGFDFNGTLSHQASINLALPIGTGDGGGGFLFAVMELDWLNRLAESSQLPKGSAISVTNRKGDAVARYPDPDKWVGKSYPRAHLTGNELRRNGIRVENGIDGIKRVYAFCAVEGKGDLIVHVGIRSEDIHAPANRALINQLLALGTVSLLAVLASWFFSDFFLLKQVRALIEASKSIAAGNLGARSSLSYDKGELGDLARAFDQMAETVQWREAQLKESESERARLANHGEDPEAGSEMNPGASIKGPL
jgi:hypothetical protein